MRIIDTFPYFNEKELLELRINTLYDHVDKFIICEANKTYSGNNKEYYLEKHLQELNLPLDKIQIVQVDLSVYDDRENYFRERAQRNGAISYIEKDDVCIVSDCDELINPKFINYYTRIALENPNNILRIPMVHLHGRADLEVYDQWNQTKLWTPAFICLYSHLKQYDLSQIRESNSIGYNFEIGLPNIYITENNKIETAGWHFAWMGNGNRRLLKYKSSSHYNDYIETSITAGNIEKTEEYISRYNPSEGSIDSLGRSNHILNRYSIQLLPNTLFSSLTAKKYLLPNINELVEPLYNNEVFKNDKFNALQLYYNVVKKFESGSKFVEISNLTKGKSTVFMCVEIINSRKDIDFYSIFINNDIKSYNEFISNTKPIESCFFPICLNSIDASKKFKNKSLDFVFFNDYTNIKEDILAWLPKLKNGGILAGVDYYPYDENMSNVYKIIHELFNEEYIEILENCFIINITE